VREHRSLLEVYCCRHLVREHRGLVEVHCRHLVREHRSLLEVYCRHHLVRVVNLIRMMGHRQKR
jgi:hypothetical protein